MPTKRKNPLENAMNRIKTVAASVDSVMMARMPKDFQEMQRKRKEKGGKP